MDAKSVKKLLQLSQNTSWFRKWTVLLMSKSSKQIVESYPYDTGFKKINVNGAKYRTIYTNDVSFGIFERLVDERMKEYDVTQAELDQEIAMALKK